MKSGTKTKSVTIRLTPRQHAALRAYTQANALSIAAYGRSAIVSPIPSEFWDREEVPPGQLAMSIESA